MSLPLALVRLAEAERTLTGPALVAEQADAWSNLRDDLRAARLADPTAHRLCVECAADGREVRAVGYATRCEPCLQSAPADLDAFADRLRDLSLYGLPTTDRELRELLELAWPLVGTIRATVL